MGFYRRETQMPVVAVLSGALGIKRARPLRLCLMFSPSPLHLIYTRASSPVLTSLFFSLSLSLCVFRSLSHCLPLKAQENIFVEFSHQELLEFYNKLEIVQGQLDSLT
ncbi:unnamed protein product [Arctogadus glacialis]